MSMKANDIILKAWEEVLETKETKKIKNGEKLNLINKKFKYEHVHGKRS